MSTGRAPAHAPHSAQTWVVAAVAEVAEEASCYSNQSSHTQSKKGDRRSCTGPGNAARHMSARCTSWRMDLEAVAVDGVVAPWAVVGSPATVKLGTAA